MSASVRRYAFALAPLSAAALWGGLYVVSKWGFALIPPITLGFLRVTLGAVALWLVVRGGTVLPGRDPIAPAVAREDWRPVLVLGGWVSLTVVTQFLGTALTNASQGSLLTVLTPVFVVGLGAAVLDEDVTRRTAGGVVLAAAGTGLVVAGRYDLGAMAAGNAAGVGLLLVGSLAWAGYTVWGLPVVRRYSALTATTYAALAAVPMLAVLSAAELRYLGRSVGSLPLSAGSVFAVAYLGIAATAAAWYLWYKGLEYVPAGSVAVFFFVQPVVGTALGAALLGEQVGLGFLAGSAVICAGILVVSRERATDAG